MRHPGPVITGALLGGLGLILLPLSGLFSHDATGSGAIATWYRGLALRQSVTLRAALTFAPALTAEMAARGAGHYALLCAGCHGAPDRPPAAFSKFLSPRPPQLSAAPWRSAGYQFHVLRDGIRNSAMPAWLAPERGDEIWDMVAFLRLLPGLDAASYTALAGQGQCSDCHGVQGEGRAGMPRLNIQTPEYLAASLRAYRDGSRPSAPMQAATAALSDAEIDALATAFGRAEHEAPNPGDPGADLARHGLAARDIPACLSCHGPQARADYPRLSGQDRDYLQRQLRLFQQLGEQRGGPHAAVMAPIAARLSQQQTEEILAYFGRQASAPGAGPQD